MSLRCQKCSGKPKLQDYIAGKLEDMTDIATFKQRASVHRTQLTTQTTSVAEYIEKLVDKLTALIPHSFIAKSQSMHFKEQREFS